MFIKKENVSKKFFRVVPNAMSMVRCHVKKTTEEEFSFAKFRVMANISRGINTVGEIAGLHGVSQPAISKLVDSLAQDKLIIRNIAAIDRRVSVLDLTPAGAKKLEEFRLKASNSFNPLLKLLNNKEKNELSSALDCLDSFLKKIQESKV